MNDPIQIKVRDLDFFYHGRQILNAVNADIERNAVTAVTGPSGQGKSTFLMTLNRLWENIEGARANGDIRIDFGNGYEDIQAPGYPVPILRQKVGMVFQTPNPLPMSICKNVAFPLKLKGEKRKDVIEEKVCDALKKAHLWDEVKDRLNEDAPSLSGGQQQRLCMARALVLDPQVLLLDEPTSSLDEASAGVIEDLLIQMKKTRTIVLVSHYMEQVGRIADHTMVLKDRQLFAVDPDNKRGNKDNDSL